MAPEQFEGESGAASDIYSLGITLYEAAVLQPAFRQGSHAQLLEQISKVGPTQPRNIAPTIPRDLETIADLQVLPEKLKKRGYSDTDLAAIFHGNWHRFLSQVLGGC